MNTPSTPQYLVPLALPLFGMHLVVPTLTPLGYPVDRIEENFDSTTRLHIRSLQHKEVYFELTRYKALTAAEEYAHHRESLARRFAGKGFAITDLKETHLKGKPAHEYTFQWEQSARVVLFIERHTFALRILYDPLSPVNLQILSNLEFAPEAPERERDGGTIK